MAKQKVVLKLSMGDAKNRAKAMKCVAGMLGVFSVSQDGEKMTVVGEIDPVTLTMLLRKKMRCVSLEVVTPVEEKKEEKEEKKEEAAEVKSYIQPVVWPITQPRYCVDVMEPCYFQHNCSIM